MPDWWGGFTGCVTKDVLTHHGQKLFYFTDLNGYVIGVTQKQNW